MKVAFYGFTFCTTYKESIKMKGISFLLTLFMFGLLTVAIVDGYRYRQYNCYDTFSVDEPSPIAGSDSAVKLVNFHLPDKIVKIDGKNQRQHTILTVREDHLIGEADLNNATAFCVLKRESTDLLPGTTTVKEVLLKK